VRHDIDIQKERQAFKIDIAPKKEMYKEIHWENENKSEMSTGGMLGSTVDIFCEIRRDSVAESVEI
jgi:hypothetical protein